MPGWLLTALGHRALAFEARGDVLSDGVSYLFVVSSDERRVLVRACLAVEKDYGYAAVVGPVDGRSYRIHLVRRNYEQVDALVGEGVYLPRLLPVVVVGRHDAQLYVVMQVSGVAQLAVKLLAPVVLAALRNAYNVGFLALIASKKTSRQADE